MTTGRPPNPYPSIIIGMPERKVPNTGINQAIKTMSESVKINGNTGNSPDHQTK
jgi:hypothetical protein